jgi:hypothetical protein
MSIVAQFSWDDIASADFANPARKAFREAVEEVAVHAREKLPQTVNGRIDAAVKIVLQGDVELLPEDKARVGSQTQGTTIYHIVDGTCDCRDFAQSPDHWCKHRIAFGIYKRALALAKQQLEAAVDGAQAAHPEPTSSIEASGTASIPAQFLTEIHGKQFVKYEGLLAMAHEKGLINLSARFISVNNDLALSEATAVFADGKSFSECADATPQNVGPNVRAHYIRISLTRAKARCLRDALNIAVCSVEELEA